MTIASSVFFFQAEDGIRDGHVTGVQTCALPISICHTWTECQDLFFLLGKKRDIQGHLWTRTNQAHVPTKYVNELRQLIQFVLRSEERRVGKECRSRCSRDQ